MCKRKSFSEDQRVIMEVTVHQEMSLYFQWDLYFLIHWPRKQVLSIINYTEAKLDQKVYSICQKQILSKSLIMSKLTTGNNKTIAINNTEKIWATKVTLQKVQISQEKCQT